MASTQQVMTSSGLREIITNDNSLARIAELPGGKAVVILARTTDGSDGVVHWGIKDSFGPNGFDPVRGIHCYQILKPQNPPDGAGSIVVSRGDAERSKPYALRVKARPEELRALFEELGVPKPPVAEQGRFAAGRERVIGALGQRVSKFIGLDL